MPDEAGFHEQLPLVRPYMRGIGWPRAAVLIGWAKTPTLAMVVDRVACQYAVRHRITVRETVLSITESAETAALHHCTDRVLACQRSEHGGWWAVNPDLIPPNDLRLALRMCADPIATWSPTAGHRPPSGPPPEFTVR